MTLSISEIADAVHEVAEETRLTFGPLDQHELNWRPHHKQWSVAQCFEHLVTGNRLLIDAAKSALAAFCSLSRVGRDRFVALS